MTEERPQDVGRSHARKPRRGAEDPLLGRYQSTMRTWLTRLLDDLDGRPAAPGLMPDAGDVTLFPDTGEASKLWDLAIKLGKELGSAIDPAPAPGTAALTARGKPRARRATYE